MFGAGKSTQVRLLSEALEEAGKKALVLREPGGTPATATHTVMRTGLDTAIPRRKVALPASRPAFPASSI